MVLRSHAGAGVAVLVMCATAQTATGVPSLPAGFRGLQPLKDVDPACNGKMLCASFSSDEATFLVNSSNTSLGCTFGHEPMDGSCAVPCRGVLHKPCKCLSHGAAVSHIKKRGAVTMLFGMCFMLVGVCVACCLSSTLDVSSWGGDSLAADPAATEMSRTNGRQVHLLTPDAERATSRLITDRPGATARKRRILCQLFFSVFFLIWFFFAGFLLFFGFWLLFFQESIYYDGCSK